MYHNNNRTVPGDELVWWVESVKQSDIARALNSFLVLSFQDIFSMISLICLFMMPGIQLTFSFTILWYSY